MSILDEIVVPVFEESGIPCLRDRSHPGELFVPYILDEERSARTLIHIVSAEGTTDAQVWADLCSIPSGKRAPLLEAANQFNTACRWFKAALSGTQVILEVDLLLGRGPDATDRFKSGFQGYLDALRAFWPDVSRVLSRRGRQSRLEREVSGLLAKHAGD